MKEKTSFLTIKRMLLGMLMVFIVGIFFCCKKSEKPIIPLPKNTTHIIASDSFVWHVERPVVVVKTEKKRGTGFFVSQKGKFVRVLTCEHFIRSQNKIEIHSDKKIYPAIVIGTNSLLDVAALQIEVPDDFHAPIVKLGNSDILGKTPSGCEFVLICGYSKGEKAIRLGIFREKWPYCFKLDLPVQFGNSGAPLFNFRGEIIGIFRSVFPHRIRGDIPAFATDINNIKLFLSSLPKPSETDPSK